VRGSAPARRRPSLSAAWPPFQLLLLSIPGPSRSTARLRPPLAERRRHAMCWSRARIPLRGHSGPPPAAWLRVPCLTGKPSSGGSGGGDTIERRSPGARRREWPSMRHRTPGSLPAYDPSHLGMMGWSRSVGLKLATGKAAARSSAIKAALRRRATRPNTTPSRSNHVRHQRHGAPSPLTSTAEVRCGLGHGTHDATPREAGVRRERKRTRSPGPFRPSPSEVRPGVLRGGWPPRSRSLAQSVSVTCAG
jgi:hypothetical protein